MAPGWGRCGRAWRGARAGGTASVWMGHGTGSHAGHSSSGGTLDLQAAASGIQEPMSATSKCIHTSGDSREADRRAAEQAAQAPRVTEAVRVRLFLVFEASVIKW